MSQWSDFVQGSFLCDWGGKKTDWKDLGNKDLTLHSGNYWPQSQFRAQCIKKSHSQLSQEGGCIYIMEVGILDNQSKRTIGGHKLHPFCMKAKCTANGEARSRGLSESGLQPMSIVLLPSPPPHICWIPQGIHDKRAELAQIFLSTKWTKKASAG